MKTLIAGLFVASFAIPGLGCGKSNPGTSSTAPGSSGTSSEDSKNTNFQAGGGAIQNTRKAARRTVALNDMNTLGLAMTQYELDNNKMPTIADTKKLLVGYPNILSLVNDGTIILTGGTDRSGLWAYEVDADTKGGIGLVSGKPNRYNASEIKAFLGL